jgi:hypothetical protein
MTKIVQVSGSDEWFVRHWQATEAGPVAIENILE